jgi:hypothetical protein
MGITEHLETLIQFHLLPSNDIKSLSAPTIHSHIKNSKTEKNLSQFLSDPAAFLRKKKEHQQQRLKFLVIDTGVIRERHLSHFRVSTYLELLNASSLPANSILHPFLSK